MDVAEAVWTGSAARQLEAFGSSRDGLASAEAASRFARTGPNSFDEPRHLRWLGSLAARFRNPLVLVLLASAAVSALTGDVSSFAIITTVVIMSLGLGLSEHPASAIP